MWYNMARVITHHMEIRHREQGGIGLWQAENVVTGLSERSELLGPSTEACPGHRSHVFAWSNVWFKGKPIWSPE